MIGDFNIRDSNWNPSYPYYSIYADVFREVANSFNLEISMSFLQVSTWYADNSNNSKLVINLMFLCVNSEEFNNYSILSDLQSLFDHTFLTVDIIINKEFI